MAETLKQKIAKKEELLQRINNLRIAADEESANLAYADHGAFGQAKDYIRELEREAASLDRQIDILMGNVQPMAPAPVYVAPEFTQAEKDALMRDVHAYQEKKSQQYVNRFKKNRTTGNSGHYQKFYLEPIAYDVAQKIKAESIKGEFRWDPYIKRWYFNIYLFNGQKFSPCEREKQYMLDSEKNHTAHLWSAEIQRELENCPAEQRPYTVKIHGTPIPNIRK